MLLSLYKVYCRDAVSRLDEIHSSGSSLPSGVWRSAFSADALDSPILKAIGSRDCMLVRLLNQSM
jgi:hypothetical protein